MRTSRPVLSGCRILVTSRRRSDEVSAALTERGAEVVWTPTLATQPGDPGSVGELTRAMLRSPPDVVVVSTATGLASWVDLVASAGLGEQAVPRVLRRTRVVARGPKTRQALQEQGVEPDWLGEAETGEAILSLLRADGVAGRRVAVLRGGGPDPALEAGLAAAGAHVIPLHTYRWTALDRRADVLAAVDEVAGGTFDAALFTSRPGAEAWLGAVRRRRVLDAVRQRVGSRQLLLAAVGPVTAAPLAYAGLLASVPATSRLADLVRLVLDRLGDERHALRTGQGELRLRAGAITLDHRTVPLSPSGLALLRRLAATPGHVVSREELLRALPGESTDPHAAEVAVARLRESLRAATGDGSLVRTVVRRGYVLAAR